MAENATISKTPEETEAPAAETAVSDTPATETPAAETPKPAAPASDHPAEEHTKSRETTRHAGTGSIVQISREQLDMDSLRKIDIPDVHSRIQTEFESNRGYQMVADKIITVSQKHLADQQRDKVALRKQFAKLFSVLLILEYAALVIFILLDAIHSIPVDVPDSVLQLFISSVFLQTLTSMGVMIAFAFVSKEETRIVGLLNQIIQNYQKFQIDAPPKEPKA